MVQPYTWSQQERSHILGSVLYVELAREKPYSQFSFILGAKKKEKTDSWFNFILGASTREKVNSWFSLMIGASKRETRFFMQLYTWS